MKYLLPIAAASIGLIVYAVIKVKRKEQWIPLGGNIMIPDHYTLEPSEPFIIFNEFLNEEVGY